MRKIREDMTGGPSNVFTPKAVADKIFIRDSSANQSLKSMRASYIPVKCVKICRQDCAQDGVWFRYAKMQDQT